MVMVFSATFNNISLLSEYPGKTTNLPQKCKKGNHHCTQIYTNPQFKIKCISSSTMHAHNCMLSNTYFFL